MAKLADYDVLLTERKPGEPIIDYYDRQAKDLNEAFDKTAAMLSMPGKRQLVGALLKFPVADGYAYYQIVEERPLTLASVMALDNYRVHPALIRGLTKSEIVWQLNAEADLHRRLRRPDTVEA